MLIIHENGEQIIYITQAESFFKTKHTISTTPNNPCCKFCLNLNFSIFRVRMKYGVLHLTSFWYILWCGILFVSISGSVFFTCNLCVHFLARSPVKENIQIFFFIHMCVYIFPGALSSMNSIVHAVTGNNRRKSQELTPLLSQGESGSPVLHKVGIKTFCGSTNSPISLGHSACTNNLV